ncbi:MAG TPA: CRISPR-associated endonuclease Cas2 [Candidatus Paceibacterota bacterium]
MKIGKNSVIKKRNNIKSLLLELLASTKGIAMDLLLDRAQRHTELSVDWQTGRYHFRSYANASVARLHKSGLIKFETKNDRKFLRLTDKGEEIVAKYKLGSLTIKKPWRWDGKWRLVMFDVKESRKIKRDLLRKQLSGLGFVRLQNSVWVYPYPCQAVSILIKAGLKMAGEVLYVTADEIENDTKLRRHFSLN